jgi:hypothetical protein
LLGRLPRQHDTTAPVKERFGALLARPREIAAAAGRLTSFQARNRRRPGYARRWCATCVPSEAPKDGDGRRLESGEMQRFQVFRASTPSRIRTGVLLRERQAS